jgi:hypothetical protein
MKFVPYDKKNIEKGVKRKSDNFKLLFDFQNSDLDCAKVLDYTQKNAAICQTSLMASIKRYHFNNIFVIVRKENVYLIKKDI